MRHLATAFQINGTAGSSFSGSKAKPFKASGKSPNPPQNARGGSTDQMDRHSQMDNMDEWLGLCPPWNLSGLQVVAWPPFMSKHSETRPQGMMALLSWPKLLASQNGFHLLSQLMFQVFNQLFVILKTPRGSKLALKICVHF